MRNFPVRFTFKHDKSEPQSLITLFASGLIVGESLVGVLLAAVIAVSVSGGGSESPLALAGAEFHDTAQTLGLMAFLAILAIFGKTVLKQ